MMLTTYHTHKYESFYMYCYTGQPISDVYDNWGPGEPNDSDGVEDCVILRRDGTLNDVNCAMKNPFICKKTLDSLEWNSFCNMPNTGNRFCKMCVF